MPEIFLGNNRSVEIQECGDSTCPVCHPLSNEAINSMMAVLQRQQRERQREQRRQERLDARLNADANDETNVKTDIGCDKPNCKICDHKNSPYSGILRGAVVHSYSYRPRRLRMNALRGEDPKYYFGVELETDQNDWRVDNETAAAMRLPYNFWFPKHDGSVSGPEFVSHPATLAFWKSRKRQLTEMFDNLLHAGYSSHNNGHCGMHVNISRTAFDNEKHMYRFLTLLHVSPPWSLKMAQRTADQMRQWAQLGMDTAEKRREAARRSMVRGGQNGYGKYAALGTPYDGQRFEFRLPRGNLRIDRFYKNLEWTAGMIEYTRFAKAADITPRKFMNWVLSDKRDEYEYLAAFINEKFGVKNATSAR